MYDVIRESLESRNEHSPAHPFWDFGKYETEGHWRRYFHKAVKRRFIRNRQRRAHLDSADVANAAADPSSERMLSELRLALQEIENLPECFSESQIAILKQLLQGGQIDHHSSFSPGYVRKVLRKAIEYFRRH